MRIGLFSAPPFWLTGCGLVLLLLFTGLPAAQTLSRPAAQPPSRPAAFDRGGGGKVRPDVGKYA